MVTPHHDYYPLTREGQQQIPWFLRGWITPREPPDRNVVLTVGALHQVDSIALHRAASLWHDELAVLPKPLVVVNIGGPTGHCGYGVDLAKQLIASLLNVLSTCGSLRVSFSRRTPKQVCYSGFSFSIWLIDLKLVTALVNRYQTFSSVNLEVILKFTFGMVKIQIHIWDI